MSRQMDVLIQPWRSPAQLWRSIAYVALGLPMGIATFTTVATLGSVAGSLLITFVFALPFVWLLFAFGRVIGWLERSRATSLLGMELVDPVAPLQASSWLRRLWERCRSGPRWMELVHGVALLPVGTISFTVLSAVWSGSAALVLLPLYVGNLPGGTAKFWVAEVGPGAGSFALAAAGLVGLVVVAPWVSLALSNLQGGLARRTVGTLSEAAVADRLQRAELQRSAAVGSAEAERRRIERDLHDGAQQRLVALAANLGAAREKLTSDPEAGQALVADAHEEAKAALKEIRDLVRGIHPVILEDRGLDAALSAVIARSPVPVHLDVHATPRPPAEVESAAYFVVSEALTNVARHAQATRAHVSVARAGDRLVIEVRDDGVGGADASRGTGLQGLRERITGMGGDLQVISPPGGPTTISVELPCAS